MSPGLVVDLFAGGGGASLGIERGLGRAVDIAINHDRLALAMHAANHTHTRHLCEDVFDVDPCAAVAGKPVDLLWASPDCKHFSKAKGGKPVSKRIRSLAWVVVRWAAAVRPRVIMLENVEEFTTWGPLDSTGRPCKRRQGRTFALWVQQLRNLGYAVEWRELRACDYGAPTIRKRLFIVARCDGQPIVWPAPTHGPGLQPYRTAAECIDWSLPCPSIFERTRPLVENTLRRIANGIRRYVLEAAEPFIVRTGHYSNITGDGAAFRGQSLRRPLATVCAGGNDKALVVPYVGKQNYGSKPCHAVSEPLHTITTQGNKHALVAAFIAKHFGGMVGVDVRTPLPTTTARGTQNQIVTAHLSAFYSSNTNGGNGDPRRPMKTVTAGGQHIAEVRTFLVKYYGTAIGQSLREPLHTVTSRNRLGLVMVAGEEWQIVDIGMRMLTPRELARAQGFDDDYVLTGTKTDQIARIGNSVCPCMAEALVRANVAAQSREGVA